MPIESPERVSKGGILAQNWFGWFPWYDSGLDTFAPPRTGRVNSCDCKRRPNLYCPSIYSAVLCEELRSHILSQAT